MWTHPKSLDAKLEAQREQHQAAIRQLAANYAGLQLKAAYRGHKGAWEGVVKTKDGLVVHTCGHAHHNRYQTTRTNGLSAVDCAKRVISAVVATQAEHASNETTP